MKIKKASIISMVLVTLLTTTIYAEQNLDELFESGNFHIANQSEEEIKEVLQKIYDNTGNIPTRIEAGRIFIEEEKLSETPLTKTYTEQSFDKLFESSDFHIKNQNEEEVKEVLQKIYDNTGNIPTRIEAGRIFIEEEKLPEARATSAPTQLMPGKSFTSDWSGTKNYTYTKYLTPDFIWAQAATDFYAGFYDSNGNYLFSTEPYVGSESDYTYVLGMGFESKYGNVYAILYNKANTPSDCATYELQNYL